MKTILLIIRREYLVRVRKRSFVVMTILGPLLIFAFYALIGYMNMRSIEQKTIQVVDESGLFKGKLKDTESLKYTYPTITFAQAKAGFPKSGANVLAYIPKDIIEQPRTLQLFAEKGVSLEIKSTIERAIEREIENIKLTEAGITRKILEDAKVNIDSETISLSEEGEKESSAGAAAVIGGITAFIIYLSIFIYGTQVMRGIMEEKSNRIVEVIISSVKPFQLMMGKIIGVGLVGLTQFLLWILLTIGLTSIGGSILSSKLSAKERQSAMVQQSKALGADQQALQAGATASADNPVSQVLKAVKTLNIPLIIGCFLFYFLGGYLLYSALFGALGAAVDNDTEVQQFMLPITLPVVFAIAISSFVIRDPDGSLAFWASMVPLTSPIIMLIRIPMGVPAWELILSMVLLVLGFLGTTWLAARIYRVGILMYGKKVTYRELSKWLFYKA
ncbi:ABC transporter permease [Tellurirhabdus rosea]|uniref:ABC transporter permease n=1 Tax=Tellurirhabdus rosea TaxID=2674997 RepID=UPI00225446C6|nr:ABC transporter permease [Tellurirhabdus rosea]